jgi:dihydrodipicolinate synthase/N-acetylneuraminate lyase
LRCFREVNGRVPVVVSTGHTGTDAAVHMSREARDLGAAALMVLTLISSDLTVTA